MDRSSSGEAGRGERPGAPVTRSSTQSGSNSPGAVDQVRDTVKHELRSARDDVQRVAADKVNREKHRIADRMDSIVHALNAARGSLDDDGQGQLARYVGDLTEQIERSTGYLRNNDYGAMMRDMENLARSNTGVFLGSMFVAGLALGRLLRASEPAEAETHGGDWRTQMASHAGSQEPCRARGAGAGLEVAGERHPGKQVGRVRGPGGWRRPRRRPGAAGGSTRCGGAVGVPADGPHVPSQRAHVRDERSIGPLFRELQQDSTTLVRQEVELAKAEIKESVRTYARSTVRMAVGGALLLAALFGLLWTVNMALTALLENAVGLEDAVWLSPLILSAVIAIIGYAMVKSASSRMREESIVPRRTTETLKEEKQWLKNRHA